jgi:calcineurin-like phosphoesterase family protein
MATFFTADQHFGHANIIGYCSRPYRDVSDMDAALVANWNSMVGRHDTVHVVGDVAMGRREESMPHIGRLAGYKILYPGNHDRCWYGHGQRATPLEQDYLDAGFDEILQGPQTLAIAGREVLVCHLPYRGDSGDVERYSRFRPVDEGMWLLHGHVHEKWLRQGRMINVGVDVWDFAPAPEQAIVKLIDDAEPFDDVG